MQIHQIKYKERLNGLRHLTVDNEIDSCLTDYILQNNVTHLSFDEGAFVSIPTAAKLNGIVRDVWVRSDMDLSFINELTELRDLSIGRNCTKNASFLSIGFSRLKQLTRLQLTDLSSVPANINSVGKLEYLVIDGLTNNFDYSVKNNDVAYVSIQRLGSNAPAEVLRLFPGTTSFGLSGSRVENLGFLAGMNDLKLLGLGNFPRCVDLSTLSELQSIQRLCFDGFKILSDISPLGKLKNLTSLDMENCPAINSIKPLLGCMSLKSLGLEGTTKVQDGNLKCALSFPCLEAFTFNNRKHYDLKEADVKKMADLYRTKTNERCEQSDIQEMHKTATMLKSMKLNPANPITVVKCKSTKSHLSVTL